MSSIPPAFGTGICRKLSRLTVATEAEALLEATLVQARKEDIMAQIAAIIDKGAYAK